MKKDFETLYQELLNEQGLQEHWEKYKKESKKKNTIFVILAIIIDVLIIINKQDTQTMLFSIITLDIILYIIISIIFSKNRTKYNNSFKNIVIKKLIDNFYNEVQYSPKHQMPRHIYDEAEYGEYYNRYYSDDYFKGMIEQKGNIEFAEIKTQKVERHRDRDGRTHTTTTTIFNGLFAKINIEKSIQTKLKIKTNWIGLGGKRKKLEMDSQLFEKEFDVYTDNQIIGMQLLTADVMEKLVEFKNTMDLKYEVHVFNNMIYLRFMTGSMFEAKISSKEMLNKKSIERYYKILEFTHSLATQLIEVIEHTEI